MGKIKAKQLALAAGVFTSGTGEALDLAEGGVTFNHLGASVPANILGSKYVIDMVASADKANPNASTVVISGSAWEGYDFGVVNTVAGHSAATTGLSTLLEMGGQNPGAGGIANSGVNVFGSDERYYKINVFDANGAAILDTNGNRVFAVISVTSRTATDGPTVTLRFFSGEWGQSAGTVTLTPYVMNQAYSLAFPTLSTLNAMNRGAFRGDTMHLSKTAAGLAADSVTEVEIASSALGDGLTGGSGDKIAVSLAADPGLEFDTGALRAKTDGTTIERKTGGALGVVDGGIGTTQLAATSVTAAILGSDVAGDGLTGGNGNALAVLAANTSVAVATGGVSAAVPVLADKALNPSGAISTNNADTGITITKTPAAGSYVKVSLNGVGVELGNGSKLKDCYFTGDAGTTARNIADIVATDALYWNAVVSGVNLSTTDEIDLDYTNTTP